MKLTVDLDDTFTDEEYQHLGEAIRHAIRDEVVKAVRAGVRERVKQDKGLLDAAVDRALAAFAAP